MSALSESATAQHEVGVEVLRLNSSWKQVGTDAYTSARPFQGRFPVARIAFSWAFSLSDEASWFISKVSDGVRHIIEQNPAGEQLSALQSQYQ